jgi:hypothetical protein
VDEPEYGDFVWIYWTVGTQFGSAGKVSGHEYTEQIEHILTAGYGVLTTQPANPGSVPTNPNAGISAAKVQELIDNLDFLTAAEGNATYATPKVVNPDALLKWRASLGTRNTAPVEVFVSGNSNWEGTGATTYPERFPKVLQDFLRARLQPAGKVGAVWPSFTWPNMTPVPTGQPFSSTGAVTKSSQFGLGRRGFKLDPTGVLTIPFVGDRVIIPYTKASLGAKFTIVLDGGAPVAIDSYAGTQVRAAWDSGALTRGDHTVVVTFDATSTAGRSAYLNGAIIYDGDYNGGIRVHDHSTHGVTINSFATTTFGWTGEFAAKTWSLGILGFGENDIASTPAQYKTDYLAYIAKLREFGMASSLLICHGPKAQAANAAVWKALGDAEREIAEDDPDIAWLDLSKAVPGNAEGGATLGIYYDGTHFNGKGQGMKADIVASALLP